MNFSRIEDDYKREIKVAIESVTHCGGSCLGCVLSEHERRVVDSTFDLNRVTSFVQKYLHSFSAEVDPHEIQIAMGQADHFLLKDGKEDEIVAWVSQLLPGRRIVASITVSAIGKPFRIARKVELWKNAIEKYRQPVNIDLVFDPVKMRNDKFYDSYQENFSIIKKVFGDVDLNINIGPDTVSAITPRELIGMARSNSYRRLTINVTPTKESSSLFASNFHSINNFLIELADQWEFSDRFNLNYIPSIAIFIEEQMKSNLEWSGVVSRLQRRLLHEVYITNDYRATNVQSGFGDIALSARHGFGGGILIDGDIDSLSALRSISNRNGLHLASKIIRDPRCAECSFATVCLQTGGAVIAANVDSEQGCPSGLTPVYKKIADIVAKNQDAESASYHNKKVDVPSFFIAGDNLSPVENQASGVQLRADS